MKKSMFITSVIMVVVLAIALTTSSLAWYNGAAGSPTVTAGSLSVSSVVRDDAKGLLIGAAEGTWESDHIFDLDDVTGLTPAAPENCPGDDPVTELRSNLAEGHFGSLEMVVGAYADSAEKVDATVAETVPFYVANTKNEDVAPVIDIEFTGADSGEAVLVVAVLFYDEGTSSWKLAKIETSTGVTNITTFNEAAEDGRISTQVNLEFSINQTWDAVTLAAAEDGSAWGTAVQFKAVAWYDGSTLFNSNSNTSVSYSITFSVGA